ASAAARAPGVRLPAGCPAGWRQRSRRWWKRLVACTACVGNRGLTNEKSRAVRTARPSMVANDRLELHGHTSPVEAADRIERVRINVAVERVVLIDDRR